MRALRVCKSARATSETYSLSHRATSSPVNCHLDRIKLITRQRERKRERERERERDFRFAISSRGKRVTCFSNFGRTRKLTRAWSNFPSHNSTCNAGKKHARARVLAQKLTNSRRQSGIVSGRWTKRGRAELCGPPALLGPIATGSVPARVRRSTSGTRQCRERRVRVYVCTCMREIEVYNPPLYQAVRSPRIEDKLESSVWLPHIIHFQIQLQ